MTTTTTSAAASTQAGGFDVARVRSDFPILEQQVNGHALVYLDNAASAQKPRQVIDALRDYYETTHANIHRGVHHLSMAATNAYEKAREKTARFIGAARPEEIIFTRGTTESINLVAQSYGRANIGERDEIIISHMEHHSNIVPWQLFCEQTGARLRIIPITDAGEIDLEVYERLFTDRTKIVATVHVSNSLGTINPVQRIVEIAHARGVPVLLDGAQAAPHLKIDMPQIGCDFYALSSHKMFGPTGIGVLWGRHELLDAMPPYQGGGEMILSVTFDKTTYNKVPHKFEAGTPNIADAVAFGATIDYLESIGMDNIARYERDLLEYGTKMLQQVPGLRIIGIAPEKAAVLSFVLDDIHPHDIGTVLDQQGIAVRTGHHCTQPVMDRFGVPATVRASLAFYNTRGEIDRLIAGLHTVREVFS